MLIQNNTNINNKPNFKAIKSIQCIGLYKNEPTLAKELIDTFKTNTEAMGFCKKYDVDIVFDAKQGSPADATESSIIINYIDPTKSKIKRFFNALNGIKNNIRLNAWGTGCIEKESLKNATNELKMMLEPTTKGKQTSGVLTTHIKYADKDITNRITQKERKISEKEKKLNIEEQKKETKKIAEKNLDQSIKNLINITK